MARTTFKWPKWTRPATATDTVYVTDAPAITSDDFGPGADAIIGQAGQFHFAARTAGVVSYGWVVGDGDPQTVDAAAVPFTPPAFDDYNVTVVGHTADGTATDTATAGFSPSA